MSGSTSSADEAGGGPLGTNWGVTSAGGWATYMAFADADADVPDLTAGAELGASGGSNSI